MAVRASIVVKSGLMRVGQKQMDKFSLVIKFNLFSWLTLGKNTQIDTDLFIQCRETDGCLPQETNKCIEVI